MKTNKIEIVRGDQIEAGEQKFLQTMQEVVTEKKKVKWKKISKSDGDDLPVCNCLDNWQDRKNVCPTHG